MWGGGGGGCGLEGGTGYQFLKVAKTGNSLIISILKAEELGW